MLVLRDRVGAPGFGAYLSEILRTEGWTAFSERDVSDVSLDALTTTRLVILPWSTPVAQTLGTALTEFVHSGGILLCLGAPPTLQPLTGVIARPTSAKYLFVPPRSQEGWSEDITLQVHGQTTELIPVNDVNVVARFIDHPGSQAGPAAVTTRRYGAGSVATWGFDPARTVAYLRQGDPQWRGEDRDGQTGPRATDAFVGWNDLGLMLRPQADDHMRLLRSVLEDLLAERGGLPRLWYFPAGEPGLLIVTGDAHGSTATAIDAGLGLVERAGGRMSIYYDLVRSAWRARRMAGRAWRWIRSPWRSDAESTTSPKWVKAWRERGHEIAVHPFVSDDDLEASYRQSIRIFEEEGLDIQPSTIRTHAVYWRGWIESARVQQSFGFGLTLDYYQSGPWLKQSNGAWTHGDFTGSGLPMRLVDETGELLGIRQLNTTMVDEQLLAGAYDGWEGLNAEAATAVSREVLERASRVHGAPVLQFHLDFFEAGHPIQATVTRWLEQSFAIAQTLRMPIWSPAMLLTFERCREQTRITDVDWRSLRNLRFHVDAPDTYSCPVTVVLPRSIDANANEHIIARVDRNVGTVVPMGRSQLLTLTPGSHQVEVQFGAADTRP
ncbi:MAG TPA: hypothetical protein VF456_10650 [Vicinamibacterales bacterium]